MDDDYEPCEIYEAEREELLQALSDHSIRTSRGALSVTKFKIISWLAWTRETGHEPLR